MAGKELTTTGVQRTETWVDTGGINDFGCGSTGVASARIEGTRSERWVDFLLIGISSIVKHSLDGPSSDRKRAYYNGRPTPMGSSGYVDRALHNTLR
jgi:hypothetical protein